MSADNSRDAFARAHGFKAALRLPLIDRHDYETTARDHRELLKKVTAVIKATLQKAGLEVVAVDGRLKTYESCNEKIYRKRYLSLAQITDLAGVRVLCQFRDDISRVCDALRNQLVFEESEDFVDGDSEESFGYQARHLLVRLKPSHRLAAIRCEVQVRSHAMETWAQISHRLGYKREAEVPAPIRRSLNALSGLLYVADSEFMRIRDEIKAFPESVQSQLAAGHDLSLTADVLLAVVAGEYPDRETSDRLAFLDIMSAITGTKLRTSTAIRAILHEGRAAYELYEKTSPPSFGDKYAGQGVLRFLLWIAGYMQPDEWATDHNLVAARQLYRGPRGPYWPASSDSENAERGHH